MAEVTVKSISIKRGTSEKGDWVNTIITPTEGDKWTGFLDGLTFLKEGDIIDITEYQEGSGKNHNKILKYQKVGSAPPTGNGKGDMTPEMWAEKDRIERASIEVQVAYKGVPELVETLEKYPENQLAVAALNWAMSKLGYWSSLGVEPEKAEAPSNAPEMPTPKQYGRLKVALEGYDVKEAKDILIERWHTNETKHLNSEQMEDFITQLEKGKGDEPEDISF